MSCIRDIAIVGATGTVGKFILAELLKTGKHDITAITRQGSSAAIPTGVKVAQVNYDDPQSIVSSLRGKQALIITMSPRAPQDTQMKLIEAAADAGVPYVVPNGWGFDSSHPSSDESFLGPGQRAVQERIEELGKSSWIEFVSGAWYEFGLGGRQDQFGFDLRERKATLYDDGMARINVSTWEQTGRAVAAVLSLKEGPQDADDDSLTLSQLKNSNVYFSSFLVSQKDMFASALRVTGTKEDDWTIDYEKSAERYSSAVQLLHKGDRSAFQRAMYTRMFFPEEAGYGSGAACFEPKKGTLNEVLGLPKEDLDTRTKVALAMAEKLAKLYE